MGGSEESFARALGTCESLLRAENEAIGRADAEAIEAILSQKDEAFAALRKAGENLGYPPTDEPTFTARIESIFSKQQTNLELMQEMLSMQRSEGEGIHEGKARLRMLKGVYRPSGSGGDR